MTESVKWSIRPLHATLAGAISGAGFLAVAVFAGWERETLLPDEEWYETLPFGPAIIGGVVGAVVGGLFGLALWVALTRRPVHPLYMALAWGFLAVALATPLHFWYWSLDAPGEESGLGGAFHAIGVFRLYLHAVLPGSAIAGVVLGAVIGVVKGRRHARRISAASARWPAA